MRFRIGERQGGTPRAAEHLPALDAELAAHLLDVRDQVPGGVVDEIRVRRGASATALVEQDDAVLHRIVETPHLVAAARAGPAVQHYHGLAVWIAALLVIERVSFVDLEGASVVGLDLGKERAHRWHP